MRIQDLIAEVTEINTANGWRERDLSPWIAAHPRAQIAGMTFESGRTARAIEAIRTGWVGGHYEAAHEILERTGEYYLPVYGSKVELLSWLRLIDTETAEASEAVINGDTENLAEELADIVIRTLDFAGGWNERNPDRPIDLEAAIMAKLERNRQRGYRHGGKRA